MKRFVINLDRATERLAWINANFERLGLSFERVPAVDKDLLSDKAISEIVDPASTGWSRGEVACFLSHIAVWRRVATGSDDFAAVFEDDVHFSQDAAKYLSDAAWVPAGVEMVKLETTLNPVITGRQVMVADGHNLLLLRSFHNGSAGYVISKGLASKFVAASATIDRPVDDFIFDKGHGVEVWQIAPALCVQDMFLLRQAAKMPSSLEADRQSARGMHRWKSKSSPMKKLHRELRRAARQLLRRRGSIIPIEVESRHNS